MGKGKLLHLFEGAAKQVDKGAGTVKANNVAKVFDIMPLQKSIKSNSSLTSGFDNKTLDSLYPSAKNNLYGEAVQNSVPSLGDSKYGIEDKIKEVQSRKDTMKYSTQQNGPALETQGPPVPEMQGPPVPEMQGPPAPEGPELEMKGPEDAPRTKEKIKTKGKGKVGKYLDSIDKNRAGRTVLGLGVGSTAISSGIRILGGHSPLEDRNGNTDLPGIPFI